MAASYDGGWLPRIWQVLCLVPKTHFPHDEQNVDVSRRESHGRSRISALGEERRLTLKERHSQREAERCSLWEAGESDDEASPVLERMTGLPIGAAAHESDCLHSGPSSSGVANHLHSGETSDST